jgi:hypothetical protein
MQRIIFDLLFPIEKKIEKGVEKSDNLKKKFFLGKTQKRKVFIFEKVKLRVGLYFSGSVYIWDVWDMAEKNTQSL